METINIICIDDQQEVLDSVMRDLRPLTPLIRLEEASGVEDCLSLMNQIDADGDYVGIVISDQVMPEANGTELLAKVASDRRFAKTRKVLLTGQATHADTINAINEATHRQLCGKALATGEAPEHCQATAHPLCAGNGH